MRQLVLDLALAKEARDQALEDVARPVPEWMDEAEDVVLHVARALHVFTSDDVWAAGLEKPREPRALGAVMMSLSNRGLIRKTGRYVRSAQVSRHNAPIAEWVET